MKIQLPDTCPVCGARKTDSSSEQRKSVAMRRNDNMTIHKLLIDGIINVKHRTNHKDCRWCFGCNKPNLHVGDEYFKVWDGRIRNEKGKNFCASYCVDCFKKSIYNNLYTEGE